jgi:predicted 3-demethylubiquinone-9 3-methyltransferase (glyoxalase superfamily)
MGVTVCLWFDDQAEDAAGFYTSVLRDGKLGSVQRYTNSVSKVSGQPVGSVMTVDFEVEGQRFQALNGGPHFTFSEAISLVVERDTQDEIDDLWAKMLQGGGREQQCGWLKDRFGVSWQIVPSLLRRWSADDDPARSERVGAAIMGMVKLDIAELERAYAG